MKQVNVKYGFFRILGITMLLILEVLAIALGTSTITDKYFTIGSTSYNESGVYYNDKKSFSRTADVVVCRGQNTTHDAQLETECDIVCKSTDNDCTNIINNKIESNSNIYFKEGNYFLWNNNTNIEGYEYGILLFNKHNITLKGKATFFQDSLNSANAGSVLLIFNSSNININDLQFIYNGSNTADQTNKNNGINIIDSKNIFINKVLVSKFNNFQLSIESYTENTSNIKITNSILEGVGNNDIIGGGTSNNAELLGRSPNNILINGNDISHVQNLSDYFGGIVSTGVYSVIVTDNILEDSWIAFSFEKCPNNNLIIGNNIIKRSNLTIDHASFSISCSTDIDYGNRVVISDNLVYGMGGISMINVNKASIIGNIFDNDIVSAKCLQGTNLSNLTLSDNRFYNCAFLGGSVIALSNTKNSLISNNFIDTLNSTGSGSYTISINGTNNKISDNIINHRVNNSIAININSHNNTIINNLIHSESKGIKVISTASNNYIEDNIIYSIGEKYDSTTFSNNYIDNALYTTLGTCSNNTVFSGKTITNVTGSSVSRCTCVDNSWKCGKITEDLDKNIGWGNLTNYPTACSTGDFMSALGDVPTCATPNRLNLTGSGNDYVCVNATGFIYRSDLACT